MGNNIKNLKIYKAKAWDNPELKVLTGKPSVDKPWMQYYTEEQQNLELPNKTIYRYMKDNSRSYLDKTAINYFGVKITYQKLLNKIDEVARALKTYGIKNGDVVTICIPNIPEAAYLFYALNKIGAIVNFVHPLSKQKNFEHYLEDVHSDILFVFDDSYEEAAKVANTKLKHIVTISPTNSIPLPLVTLDNMSKRVQGVLGKEVSMNRKIRIPQNERTMNWKQFLKNGKNYQGKLEVPYEENKAAVMVHTGGTTGEPKGVLLSNENYNSEVAQIACRATFQVNDVMLGITPPFISYVSCNALHMPLSLGLELAMIPEFFPSKFDEYMKKYHPQIIQGNPGYTEALTRNQTIMKENMNLSFLTYLVSGGDKMYYNQEVLINDFLKAHHSEIQVTKGLGCTECTSCTTFTFDEANRLESVGIPLVKTDIMIINSETGKEVGYNEPGELCISGPTVMLEYYNHPEETKKALQIHDNGKLYYHTGDIVRMDTDGHIFHEDRERRIFLTQEENTPAKVFPNKVENVILKHPKVLGCVVVGVAHQDYIHLPKAYIKLEAGTILDETLRLELNDLCTMLLDQYMLPYDYEVVENFPLTAIGKIDYRILEHENQDVYYQKIDRNKTYKKTIK